jgi:ATP-dependent Clp protease protease subunit
MFSIYDLLRDIRKEHEVHTFGIGKVMSAGVLLLAAGTKGKRRIGKNCRVMIHPVVAGCEGSYLLLENEMEEIRYLQNQYKKRLVKETNITMRSLNKYFKLGKNIYLSAEDALEMGMADTIV